MSNSSRPWTAACQASLSITNSWSSFKLMSIESVMPSNNLILCCPLLLLPSIFPSIRVFFKWVSSSHEVAKVSEFQLQHQSFQWTPRTDVVENGLVGSPCSPRDSQESSPTPQFKSINSLAIFKIIFWISSKLLYKHIIYCINYSERPVYVCGSLALDCVVRFVLSLCTLVVCPRVLWCCICRVIAEQCLSIAGIRVASLWGISEYASKTIPV